MELPDQCQNTKLSLGRITGTSNVPGSRYKKKDSEFKFDGWID